MRQALHLTGEWRRNFMKISLFATALLVLMQIIYREQVFGMYWHRPTFVYPVKKQLVSDPLVGIFSPTWNATDRNNRTIEYTYNSPILWVGGMPRSGTTLMRVILDAHDDIRCAPETRVIPRMLLVRGSWNTSLEATKLHAAGVTESIIDKALANFIMSVLVEHGEATRILCNKDPYTLENATYLTSLFPNSRFILMIRDPRAVSLSIIKQNMKIIGCMTADYGECMRSWNRTTTTMLSECDKLGPKRCMPVFYELMVQDFPTWVTRIMNFLNLPFNSNMLNFHEHVGVPGGIAVSQTERSTNQVSKPLYQEGLTDWMKDFPMHLYHNASHYAPLMAQLGYDTLRIPPNYTALKIKRK